MPVCNIDKNFLLFISCYNIGVSPSILNLIDFLSEKHQTIILLFNVAGTLSSRFNNRSIRVIHLEDYLGNPERIAQIRQLANGNTVHIAFEPHGFALAMLLYPDSRPYYYSLELYMSYDHFGLDYQDEIRSAERSLINRMSGLIIQSAEKEKLFRADYQLDDSIPSFLLPVTGKSYVCSNKSRLLRETYNIDSNRKIALALGEIKEWYASIELAWIFSELSDWVLVFHGYSSTEYLAGLHEVIKRHSINNVIVSTELLEDPEALTPIIQSSDVGIAWYADISVGFRMAGRSSGKIASYLRHGLPVITTRYPSTVEAIENTGCGVCVDAIAEMPGALDKVSRDYRRYSDAAVMEYEATYNFERYRDSLATFLRMTGHFPCRAV
jgi:glycosyltransferase involved in cell wall biosynthesis